MKYKYVTAGNTVIALSTYAGKTVKGVAKCDPNDSFSAKAGEELATARCDEKVAQKRVKRAQSKLNEARQALREATRDYERMMAYELDARHQLARASAEVTNILGRM